MKDLVSIIIPAYNRESTIEECIESIMVQSYQNFEIIIIDDGSTDKTLNICRKFAESDSRIVILEASHGGVSAARNKGLDAAKGEYIFFIDSDDVIHPLLLEELINGVEKPDIGIVGTGVINISNKYWERVRDFIKNDADPSEITYQNNLETLDAFFHKITPVNLIGGVMMRRDLIGDTRFREDLSIGEDYYFIYQNLIKGANSAFLIKKHYYARSHNENTSWDFSFKGFWSRFLRRKLVWENEEAMGRTEFVNLQKRDAFACYIRCIKNNRIGNPEIKKMKKIMRQYKSSLLPAFSLKGKLIFLLSLYFPSIHIKLAHIKHKRA